MYIVPEIKAMAHITASRAVCAKTRRVCPPREHGDTRRALLNVRAIAGHEKYGTGLSKPHHRLGVVYTHKYITCSVASRAVKVSRIVEVFQ